MVDCLFVNYPNCKSIEGVFCGKHLRVMPKIGIGTLFVKPWSLFLRDKKYRLDGTMCFYLGIGILNLTFSLMVELAR